ncbi:hypothetical protein SCUCBS95973_007029 [Sporothrix curviconia]|uniref:Protein kinase domain-containing protein n=1 Tax=Sporothrix curviconia TaxID=1260050 RepID=A0ABP0CCL0_9PEZI
MDSKDEEIARLRAELAAANEATRVANEALLPMPLMPYLAACHTLGRAIVVVTDRSLTTKGDVTDPVGRIYPRWIVPWDEFPSQQAETWRRLLSAEPATGSTDAATSSFASRRAFPNQSQMDYVLSINSPISSEHGLRYFERDTVEIPVRKLMATAFDDAVLRRRFGLRGTVDFESHTNLGDELAVDDGADGRTDPALIRRLRRVAIGRGRGVLADQFCIYRRADGADIPVTAIEYKAPHKLTPDEIITGLATAIEPDRDIINRERGDGESEFVFASKSLAAAVVTQLFSYMVGKGIRYGYICTGEVFVFLYIPDDPASVFYHVCVPNIDADDDDNDADSRLQRTAVAQVFAFTLQALETPPPTAAWFSAAAKLDTWAVEYDDILRKIPLSVRKAKEHASPYKPNSWRAFTRGSPIKTRSSQQKPGVAGPSKSRNNDTDDSEESNDSDDNNDNNDIDSNDSNDDDDDDGGGDGNNNGNGGGNGGGNTGGGHSWRSSSNRPGGTPPSPSPSGRRAGKRHAAEDNTTNSNRPGAKKRQHAHMAVQARKPIQEQPYCTQQCLLGLASGGPVDPACANAATHGPQHQIDAATCTRLLAEQIARDRDHDADFAPMFMSGLIGALYKVRLSAYGYTLVVKAVETPNRTFLQAEKDVYDRLRPMQGEQIPVCLGIADIALPLYGYGGVFHHILLLSWAGRSLARYTADDAAYSGISCETAVPAIEAAFQRMHELGVLHGDAEPRNILYDAGTRMLMVVDFERSELLTPDDDCDYREPRQ